jgi:hypothetical protein
VKAIAGGSLVVAFAMVSEAIKPKSFAGLFSAAPSIAVASLAATTAMTGAGRASQSAFAMIAGAAGMIAFCAVAALLEKKLGAVMASGLAWLSWLLVAGLVFWVVIQ